MDIKREEILRQKKNHVYEDGSLVQNEDDLLKFDE